MNDIGYELSTITKVLSEISELMNDLNRYI